MVAVDKVAPRLIYNTDSVKVTEMGFVTELMYSSFHNDIPRIRKLDTDHYIVLGPDGNQVGDVREFNHFENRASSVNSLRQTFRKLRNVINANVTDVDLVRFITLTYRQDDGVPMTDTYRLYRDFEHFNKRFQRWCAKNEHGRPEYINVVEPQGSGAWHCHVLFFWDKKAPYLPNELIRETWGQGWVTVRALKSQLGKECTNVGAYLTAYLGDLDLQSAIDARMDVTKFECKEVVTEQEGERRSKYFLKGARLFLYPPGMSIFRCSRGVKRPVETEMPYSQAKEKVSAATLTFQSNLLIQVDGKSKYLTKRYYNTAVPSSQEIQKDGLLRVDTATGEVLELLDLDPEHYPELPDPPFRYYWDPDLPF